MAGLEVHVGDVIFQAQAEIALSVGEIVDASQRCQMAGDTRRLIGVDAAVDRFGARHFQAEDKVRAAGGADRRHNFPHEPAATVEIAAPVILASVGPGRQKLIDQITMGAVQFDAGQTATLQARGGGREFRDEVVDFIIIHDMSDGPTVGVGTVGDASRGFGRVP